MRKDIARIVHDRPQLSFDRFFFKSFGDSALILELVFFVESSEYENYVDAQHELNLIIKKYVEEHGISMAFPSQTLYLKK
jgi:small-conductance mechanosensitive channel